MNYPEEEENLLIDMVCETNEEVRNSLYEKYKPTIDLIVKKYVRNAEKFGLDVNDLMQEANVGFTDAINSYDKEKDASLKTFINICIERRLMNVIQKSKTLKNQMIKDSLSLDYEYNDEGLPLKEILGDDKLDPFKTYTEKENFEQITEKIKQELSDLEYEVFLYMLNDLKYNEIANILDKSPKQIDNTMQRVRLKVKSLLKEWKNE